MTQVRAVKKYKGVFIEECRDGVPKGSECPKVLNWMQSSCQEQGEGDGMQQENA